MYTEDNADLTDKYDVYSKIIEVHSHNRNDLSSDHVLAHYDDKEKIYVVEMYTAAQLSKGVISTMLGNYDEMVKTHGLTPLTDKERASILRDMDLIYDIFMRQIDAVAVVHRNQERNPLIKSLLRDDEALPEDETTNLIKKVKDRIMTREPER